MKSKGDIIRFEYRSEVEAILIALEQWQEIHDRDENIAEMISILDDMDMCW